LGDGVLEGEGRLEEGNKGKRVKSSKLIAESERRPEGERH